MSKLVNSASELIGGTPILKADRYAANAGAEGRWLPHGDLCPTGGLRGAWDAAARKARRHQRG